MSGRMTGQEDVQWNTKATAAMSTWTLATTSPTSASARRRSLVIHGAQDT